MNNSKSHIMLDVHNLTVSYGGKPVLWEIDFEMPAGMLAGIIGPNGSGKSTLLKTIMGLIEPLSGHVTIAGSELDGVRSKISYVPQRESVDWDFPADVMDVVLMGRYMKRTGFFSSYSNADKEQALHALERVGMVDFRNRQIAKLSGGQQQRVFMARALAQDADFYLMDEPFAGVDASSERLIMDVLLAMRKQGKSLLIVHHDLHTARDYFDWVVMLNTRLVAAGLKDEVFTEKNLQQAYGGKLTVLSQLSHLVKEKQFPVREQKKK
jgi:manganese/zinc/iron transport system ATP- binding protein